ncbi:hypothetical protein V6N12_019835 [Hibiscus sabdariffa]|uniref:Uncharacterized protein n=1 Tax=Hibiscus sabdariffa TaxID=183260 RepID=A0ABR2AL18_9ROSI
MPKTKTKEKRLFLSAKKKNENFTLITPQNLPYPHKPISPIPTTTPPFRSNWLSLFRVCSKPKSFPPPHPVFLLAPFSSCKTLDPSLLQRASLPGLRNPSQIASLWGFDRCEFYF